MLKCLPTNLNYGSPMKKVLLSLFISLLGVNFTYAVESHTNETVAVEVPLENPLGLAFARSLLPQTKVVRLNKIYLDKRDENKLHATAELIQRDKLINGINQIPNFITDADFDIDLKMNNVPVLDQGPYGTCVTFATTAALDAIKETGDYASQQCLLELGNTYQVHDQNFDDISSYNEDQYCNLSGWNGFDVECSLNRIRTHGVVAKDTCPHLYPLEENSELTHEKLSFDEYKQLSHGQWSKDFIWNKLRNPNSTFDAKRSLNNGHRILISTMMNADNLRSSIGYPVNGKKAALWALPQDAYSLEEFIHEVKNNAVGHAMIITGYSDEKQVFKVRNSWGSSAGDNGEYYMTYDYYRMMNMESIEIGGL